MYVRNIEPSIVELLDDEVARLMMARDGIDAASVRALLQSIACRFAEHEIASTELTHRAA